MAKKIKTPSKNDNLSASLITWTKGKIIERIHSSQFGATEFNPGKGKSRFSPINNSEGKNISTLYGGESLAVALMETVLHDLPTPCEGAPVELFVLDQLTRSQISPKEDIQLVDLTPRFMKKHGITQADLLGSSADNYPETRQWAEKIHADNPEVQGIQWSSKQHGDKAVMLFGDRINTNDLDVTINSELASTSIAVNNDLEILADEMALVLIPKDLT
ncbi:RES family NAD+ phosphorylase [Dickeya dianthicola]|uniref:RES family NAD+ phosphorylase n=1 Tax=Dickeya dianthicola TaxID=204039 RepID=UPI0018679AEA|nr:RES family NAD+ phosphorylase [Dickeya dianthicola]QOL13586.1 RES family NAD+ phosphorylase [Dickeya dianthicola]